MSVLTSQRLSFKDRADYALHPLTKRLFNLMHEKKTNLSVAADVTRSGDLIELANTLGPYICVLKTHIDILDDFTADTAAKLREAAEKHRFLIFEDRKFADIGNTVLQQYQGGVYRISEWSHLTNAHTLPGPGIIEGLQKVGEKKGNGLLLLAHLSSQGNLIDEEYTQQTIAMANRYPEFVVGFICQKRLTHNPAFVHMTPGIQKQAKGDALGQQYTTPENAIIKHGTDIIIVGRGIILDPHPAHAARDYQQIGWECISGF